MKIISEAPCRVDLAGGTLDIWPLYLYHPGAVTLNFAINRWTSCVLETQETPEIRLRSGDLEAEETFASFDELHACKQPRLPLVTYVLRFFEPRTGLLLHTDSEAPAGAGVSGSSALIIAVASALNPLNESAPKLEKLPQIAHNLHSPTIPLPPHPPD